MLYGGLPQDLNNLPNEYEEAAKNAERPPTQTCRIDHGGYPLELDMDDSFNFIEYCQDAHVPQQPSMSLRGGYLSSADPGDEDMDLAEVRPEINGSDEGDTDDEDENTAVSLCGKVPRGEHGEATPTPKGRRKGKGGSKLQIPGSNGKISKTKSSRKSAENPKPLSSPDVHSTSAQAAQNEIEEAAAPATSQEATTTAEVIGNRWDLIRICEIQVDIEGRSDDALQMLCN